MDDQLVIESAHTQIPPQNLAAKARSAVVWNTAFNLFRNFLQFGLMLVLVRLLKPAAYGEFALVTSIIGFFAIFSFNNFIAQTLLVRDDRELRYQEQFTAGAAITVMLFLVANMVAFLLRRSPTFAPVAPLVHAMSFTFPLEWPCELRRKMLERDYDWQRLRLLHASGLIFSAVLAIGMGWGGAGAYSLVIPGMIVTLPFIIDLFFVQRWRPDWSWSWKNYRAAWDFGVTRIGSGLAVRGRQLLESSILAKVLGFTLLGFFNRAIGLAMMFCQSIAAQLMYAIYPVLTRLDPNPAHIARVNGLVLRIIGWLVIPIGAAFAILAGPVVQTVYGAKWSAVVPLLPLTMLWGILAAFAATSDTLLLAQAKPRRCLLADVITLAGTGIILLILLPFGPIAYLAGLSGVYLAVFCLSLYWLIRIGALNLQGIRSAVLPPVPSCLVAYAICEIGRATSGARTSSFLAAAMYGTWFFILYTATLRICFSRLLVELVSYLPARKYIGRVLILKPQA